MLFRQLFDPQTSTYTYLIADAQTREAVLVDPVLEQVERDLKLIQELGLKLLYCLETHIHADHITGTGKLRELSGCLGIVPENAQVDCADRVIKHGEQLQIGENKITAITTLGHTDSHNSYLVNEDRVLTGDSLLIRGCGRTDFQGGDAGTMYDHVTQRLFTLVEETFVYPGHDYRGFTVSTIGEEKQYNPRFVGQTRDSFIQLMNNLNLPDPQKIAAAVPANQSCGKVSVNV
jgi:glyoxylase-like metal-dependent hydrolase (beta-lactamase superfamily II)